MEMEFRHSKIESATLEVEFRHSKIESATLEVEFRHSKIESATLEVEFRHPIRGSSEPKVGYRHASARTACLWMGLADRNPNASSEPSRTSTTSAASAITHGAQNQQPSLEPRGSRDKPMRRRLSPRHITHCRACPASSYATNKTGAKPSCGAAVRAGGNGGLEASPRMSRIVVIAGCSVMVTRTQTLPPQRGAPVRSSDIRGNAPVVMRPGGNVFGLCAGCHERGDDAGLRDAQEAPSE